MRESGRLCARAPTPHTPHRFVLARRRPDLNRRVSLLLTEQSAPDPSSAGLTGKKLSMVIEKRSRKSQGAQGLSPQRQPERTKCAPVTL